MSSCQERPWEEMGAPLRKPQGADHRKGAQDVCGDVTAGLRGNGPGERRMGVRKDGKTSGGDLAAHGGIQRCQEHLDKV